MATTQDIVQKLWALCNVLRDDGITYQDYITELTWLLFLKMTQETGSERQLPKGYRWGDLEAKQGIEQLNFYKSLLLHLATWGTGHVQKIFADAATSLRQPRNLAKLVKDIDTLDWYRAQEEGLGDMYEGLLERNASEQKSGAGQYFTPRALIDCMVTLVRPQAGERMQDPAAGTGGFIIAADRFIKRQTRNLSSLPEQLQIFQRREAFCGVELVVSAHRLCLMNCLLHGIEGTIHLGDTLSPLGTGLPKADVILTNPPFGAKKGGGLPTREDFEFPTSNKQLAFLQHIYRSLKKGGRAAVIVPDNVLFEGGIGARIRSELLDKCNLHTLLRLPTGLFYAQGVKTSVLFFQRGRGRDKNNTRKIWVYDLRSNLPAPGKRNPLTPEYFTEFEQAFGLDPLGRSPRQDEGPEGRFRVFTRDEIIARDVNLDISWLKDQNMRSEHESSAPEEIASEILKNLGIATEAVEAVLKALAVGANV